MRHLKSGRKLGRNSSQRKALLCNLAVSLIQSGTIKTSVAKAKELRRFVEPLITMAKEDTLAHRRLSLARLRNNKTIVHKLFTQLGPRYKNRPGGYLRIPKCGFRAGDHAPMAIVQLVSE